MSRMREKLLLMTGLFISGIFSLVNEYSLKDALNSSIVYIFISPFELVGVTGVEPVSSA